MTVVFVVKAEVFVMMVVFVDVVVVIKNRKRSVLTEY